MANKINDWKDILELHESAVLKFEKAASGLALEWSDSNADRWGTAHVTEHLTMVYETLLKELDGGPGMRIRTNPFVRQILRWVWLPRLLSGAPFPKGVRAPREVRARTCRLNDPTDAITEFRRLAKDFSEKINSCYQQNPRFRLTHAYFGKGSLQQSLLLCSRHIEHHAKQLERRATLA